MGATVVSAAAWAKVAPHIRAEVLGVLRHDAVTLRAEVERLGPRAPMGHQIDVDTMAALAAAEEAAIDVLEWIAAGGEVTR